MDQYLLNDILKKRDYMSWRDGIDELNKEYDERVYYGIYVTNEECVRCRKCHCMLWNWRNMDNNNVCIFNVYITKYGHYYYKDTNVDLPKNY